MNKDKAIKIAESFLRPACSFGQTQRFIAESDIPKMVGQICDRPIGANKDKIIEILKLYSMRYGQLQATDEDIIIEASDFEHIADRLTEQPESVMKAKIKDIWYGGHNFAKGCGLTFEHWYSLNKEKLQSNPITDSGGVREEDACNAFYDWASHMEFPERNKPIALKGWRACFKWMETKPITEISEEGILIEFEKKNNPFYPNQMKWQRESLLKLISWAITKGAKPVSEELSNEELSKRLDVGRNYLMSTPANEITAENTLEALGFDLLGYDKEFNNK